MPVMKTCICLSLVLSSLVSVASFAQSSAEGFRGPRKSLAGSKWAAENPGKLPYEKCQITAQNLDETLEFAYPNSLVKPENGSLMQLVCWSDVLDLEFHIPIDLRVKQGLLSFGPAARGGSSAYTITRLNGKSVADFLGQFGGANLEFTTGAGVGKMYLSHNGIRMKDTFFEFGGRVSLGIPVPFIGALKMRANVSLRKEIESSLECEQDQYMLISSSQTVHTQKICNRSELTTQIASQEELLQYTFVQIKKPKPAPKPPKKG